MSKMDEVECLYKCGSGCAGTQEYHIYPLSASNLSLTLPKGVVCDKCNNYFATHLEKYFIDHHPGADMRVVYVEKTRKGVPPKALVRAGEITRVDSGGMSKLDFPVDKVTWNTDENGNLLLKGTYEKPPYNSLKISRALAKMAFESSCYYAECSPFHPWHPRFDLLREYARQGSPALDFVWFAWKHHGGPQQLPQFICIQDSSKRSVADLCRLSFPGIAYLLPLPPIINPMKIGSNLRGWKVIDEKGEIVQEPGEIMQSFIRVHEERKEKGPDDEQR